MPLSLRRRAYSQRTIPWIAVVILGVLSRDVGASHATDANQANHQWWQAGRGFQVSDYIWSNLEPALAGMATTVRKHIPVASISIENLTSRNYPFSAYAEFRGPYSPFPAGDYVLVSLDCGPSWVATPDSADLYCDSHASRGNGNGSKIVMQGPWRYIDLAEDDAQVRSELDSWIEAVAEFIQGRTDWVTQELGPP
jgi:hypothetical protein